MEFVGKVLMLLENDEFPADSRVRQEAYTLTSAGYKVSVIALKYAGQKWRENLNGVEIYRLPKVEFFRKSTRNKTKIKILLYRIRTMFAYMFEYSYFTIFSFIVSLYIFFTNGLDIIHAHNPPNSTFIIGGFYRLFGRKFIFDHHDLAPELFLSRYGMRGGLIHKILLLEEAACLRVANLVIATNESYKEIDIKRGNKNPDDIFIVRNGPVLRNFEMAPPDLEIRNMQKKILVYIGIMGPQDGVDYLLKALNFMINKLNRNDFYCILIGRGDSLEDLEILLKELELENHAKFTGWIPKTDLLRNLSSADICLDPNPSNPLNDFSTWIKVMEYMSYSKPIVSFDLKETRYSAQKAAVYVTPNNIEEYAKAIVALMDDPKKREDMGRFGRQRIEKELSWEIVSQNLLLAYDSILPTEKKRNLKKNNLI